MVSQDGEDLLIRMLSACFKHKEFAGTLFKDFFDSAGALVEEVRFGKLGGRKVLETVHVGLDLREEEGGLFVYRDEAGKVFEGI